MQLAYRIYAHIYDLLLLSDVMMFLNLSVALTCLAFCWALLVVAFKGWLKSRTHSGVAFHPSH